MESIADFIELPRLTVLGEEEPTRLGGGKLTLVPHQNVLRSKNERVGTCFAARGLDKISAMILSLRHLIGGVIGALGSRRDLLLENLALRQQLLSLHAKCPGETA
jgi:hypothetical protein